MWLTSAILPLGGLAVLSALVTPAQDALLQQAMWIGGVALMLAGLGGFWLIARGIVLLKRSPAFFIPSPEETASEAGESVEPSEGL
jgi:hypothetical protein